MNPLLAFSLTSMVSVATGIALMQDSTARWRAPVEALPSATAQGLLPASTVQRALELTRAAVAIGEDPELASARRATLQRLWTMVTGESLPLDAEVTLVVHGTAAPATSASIDLPASVELHSGAACVRVDFATGTRAEMERS